MSFFEFLVIEANNIDCSSSDLVHGMAEGFFEQFFVDKTLRPRCPESLQKTAAVCRIAFVEAGYPLFRSRNDFVWRMLTKFTTGAVTRAVFVEFKVAEKLFDGCPVNYWWLDEFIGWVSKSVDSAVL